MPTDRRKLRASWWRAASVAWAGKLGATAVALGVCLRCLSAPLLGQQASNRAPRPLPAFEKRVERQVERYDLAGPSLPVAAVELAYQYKTPLGIEYLDREAVRRPLSLKLRKTSVREIFLRLVAQVPGYDVSFSDGLVDIYSPKARRDSSNLLNAVIDDFAVKDLDTHRADAELFGALSRKLNPNLGYGASIIAGQWGTLRITVHLQKKRVYEILNAITAQNGSAVWTVRVPPERLSKFGGTLWYIYPLDHAFQSAVTGDILNLFASQSTP